MNIIDSIKSNLHSAYIDVRSSVIANAANGQLIDYKDVESPIFIIGISGSLHIIDLCLRFIPQNQKIIFISNGLSDWENEWALDNLQFDGVINLSKQVSHGLVLDFLFEGLEKPFGILDYDCFVLDPGIFEEIKIINSSTFINAVFMHNNEILKLEIPETFLLFFNTQIIKFLTKKFRVSCKPYQYNQISKKVKRKLATIGIDEDHFTEEYKNHFDTLSVVLSLGIAEEYNIEFIRKFPTVSQPNNEIFHIGGVSTPLAIKGPWNFRGSYFWRRCLEECGDTILQKNYWEIYGGISAKELLEKNTTYANYQSVKFFFDFIEENILCNWKSK